ncbi:MAG: amidoligase family protein [Mailhella sp.]|nr:amidoligase family protein [Mailhella sp.]
MERSFGIEMEFKGLTMQQSLAALRNAGLKAQIEGYNHNDHADGTWKIVTDASVTGGHEVVSPILRGEAGIDEACRAAEALENAGASIDKECGLHVHFDAASFTANELRTACIRYARHESEIDAFMPKSRRGDENRFCRATAGCFLNNASFMRASSKESLARSQGSRYFKVNLQAYLRHHTIEFRQHSGTVDSGKIENWVRFLAAFLDESARVAHQGADGISLQPAQQTLVDLISRDGGMTAEALQERLHILPHSLRGTISLIRKRGVNIVSTRENGTTIYRAFTTTEAPREDALFNGVEDSVRIFYERRAARFAA